MLEHVRRAGLAVALVSRAGVDPCLHRGRRSTRSGPQEHGESAIEAYAQWAFFLMVGQWPIDP
jgi:hypothetical protein